MPGDSGGTKLTAFAIEFQEDSIGSTWQVADDVTWLGDTPVTGFRHNDLKPNTEYHYRIQAASGAGASAWVDGVSGTTEQVIGVVPDPPTNLTATASGDSAVDLEWKTPVNTGTGALTGFVIQSAEDTTAASSWDRLDSIGPAETSFRHSGLEPGTTQFYRVFAASEAGRSLPSNTVSATTQERMVPSAPRNLRATAVGDSAIDLTWMAPQDSGTSAVQAYKVQVLRGTAWVDLVTISDLTNLRFRHRNLSANTEYRHRVLAVNKDGDGRAAESRTTTGGGADKPKAPSVPSPDFSHP